MVLGSMPVMDSSRRVLFQEARQFFDGLVAMLAGDRISVFVHQIEVPLQKEIGVALMLPARHMQVEAVALPMALRDQVVTISLKPASDADARRAQRMIQQLAYVLSPQPASEGAAKTHEAPQTGPSDANLQDQPPHQHPPSPDPSAVFEATSPGLENSPPAVPALPARSGRCPAGFRLSDLLLPFPRSGESRLLPENPSLYQLLASLAAAQASGTVDLKLKNGAGQLYLRKGGLAGIELPGQSFNVHLAVHLKENRTCTPACVEQALAFANANNMVLSLALESTQALAKEVLIREVAVVLQRLLHEVLAQESAMEYHFLSGGKPQLKPFSLRIRLETSLGEFVRGALRTRFSGELEPLLESSMLKYPRFVETGVLSVRELRLNDKEKNDVSRVLDGRNTLAKSFALALLSRHGTSRLVLALHHFGMIEWLEHPVAGEEDEPLEVALARQFGILKAADYFVRLDLHWATHPKLIAPALEQARERYAPDSPDARHSEEARNLCAQITVLLEEAYRVLSHKMQRRLYRVQLRGDVQVCQAADFLFVQADLVRFRGEIDFAFELLENAMDLVDNPAYFKKLQEWKDERDHPKRPE